MHASFIARVAAGLAAYRALAAAETATRLARGSRSIDAWLRDLRAAGDPERGNYRLATLPHEVLWSTLESATAAPTARAGAAFALAPSLDETSRKRLDDVAATCASEQLRLALEAVAKGDEISERLAALSD